MAMWTVAMWTVAMWTVALAVDSQRVIIPAIYKENASWLLSPGFEAFERVIYQVMWTNKPDDEPRF